MKGLLLTPVESITKNKEALEALVFAFRNKGHQINADALNADGNNLASLNEEQLSALCRKINFALKEADFVIAELSAPSSGIGYLLAQAVNEKKPIMMLRSVTGAKTPIPLQASTSRLISIYSYSKTEDIDLLVDKFLRKAQELTDTKFILILSPELDKYLEWAADSKRMHKSQLVREAIENKITEDRDYLTFIEEESQYLQKS